MLLEYYLPNQVLTNEDLKADFPDWDYKAFEEKIGIKQRHIAGADTTALDLAESASKELLKYFDKSNIDFVLLCTQSPDYFLPTSACILQNRLGLKSNCGALDFNLGCSGFVYGLSIVKGLLVAGIAKNVLFVVSETYSKHIHPKDRTNRSIFGDGAAAAIFTFEDRNKIGQFDLYTDGKGYDKLIVKNGGFRFPSEPEAPEKVYGADNIFTDNHLFMDGPDIFNFTIETIPELIENTLKKNDLTREEIDFYIFHQANAFMLNFLRKKIKIPPEKFYVNMEETGNTVSATIPIALKNAIDKRMIKSGDKVLLAGFGVGLSWGATIIEI